MLPTPPVTAQLQTVVLAHLQLHVCSLQTTDHSVLLSSVQRFARHASRSVAGEQAPMLPTGTGALRHWEGSGSPVALLPSSSGPEVASPLLAPSSSSSTTVLPQAATAAARDMSSSGSASRMVKRLYTRGVGWIGTGGGWQAWNTGITETEAPR